VQSRDSVQNFLEVADSWNITDGIAHSLAVSRDVHCNHAPFKHSAYDRTVLHQGLLRAVATEAINYILQRKTPVALVVHEQYMPVHEQVALVGELRAVPRGPALKPLTTNSISKLLSAPPMNPESFQPGSELSIASGSTVAERCVVWTAVGLLQGQCTTKNQTGY
jgi:hypothetical protein